MVSLQGTLDSFSIPDVLRFLSAGTKTGRLAVTGARGGGEVWLDAGSVVAVESAAVVDPADEALFELLREGDGAFEFQDDLTRSDAKAPLDVEGLLASAERRFAEWQEIARVVPSLACVVDLAHDLPEPTVEVNRDQWRLLVAVAREATVGGVGDQVGLAEFEISRAMKDLVERGLVVIDGSDAGSAPATANGQAPGAKVAPADRGEPVDAVSPAVTSERSAKKRTTRREEAPVRSLRVVDATDDDPLSAEEIDAVAERIAELGPAAKQAVEAAVRAATPEERDAALADVADNDPVNRGLLLKFLSSVRT